MRTPPPLTPGETAVIVAALQFTVQKALRKMNGGSDSGEITGRIVVTEILNRLGQVNDITTLTAAILHHVFDSSVSVKMELDHHFGLEVRQLVQELAGNTHLSHTEQMQELLERVPSFSPRAKEIVIAEKISKLQDMAKAHSDGWSLGQMRGYMTWMGQIVDSCRGINPYLEEYFDALYAEQSKLIPDAQD